ncbi:MAG TPA: glycosyl hydrolase family 28 protein, partial [Chitinophagaceae bacterium]
MKIPGKTVLLWALGIFSMRLSAQELVVYPPPQAIIYSAHNDDYTVKVRKPGGAWQDLFEYNVRVDMDKVQDASMVYFDFSGTVEIFIRKNNGNLQSVRIRPSAHGIIPVVKGNTISFTLARPLNLSIEFNGDKLHNLHLFASPIEKKRPDPADTNVVYFGPGVHTPPDTVKKSFYIASGKTVYIAGGAIVRGKLVCRNVNNVHIIGRGIIDQPVEGVEISGCSNVEVDGIIVVDPQHYTVAGGGSQHIVIRNLKSFSCKGWGDGLDFMSCSDVLIDNVFMRNSDDCIAIYGHRWNFYGNATNYTITNSVLWADIAHPVNIGTHGDTRIAGDTIEHILFKNIDILEQDEDDPEYEGCMAI